MVELKTCLPPTKPVRTVSPEALPGPGSWRLTMRARRPAVGSRRGWSRYERLSFFMLFWMFGVMMGITLALHLFNYHLETKTSSTSGSHRTFYGLHGSGSPSAAGEAAADGAARPGSAENHSVQSETSPSSR